MSYSFTLAETKVNEYIKRTVQQKITNIHMKYLSIREKSLLLYFVGLFRHRTFPFDRIVLLSITNIIFIMNENPKFPKFLKFLIALQKLELVKGSTFEPNFKTFLPSFYIAIKEEGFERKEVISLTFKSFYYHSLSDVQRTQYILPKIMTSFGKAETFTSFSETSNEYRHFFVLTERVNRKRPNFQYLIGSCYDRIPKEYRDFNKLHGGCIFSFAWKLEAERNKT